MIDSIIYVVGLSLFITLSFLPSFISLEEETERLEENREDDSNGV